MKYRFEILCILLMTYCGDTRSIDTSKALDCLITTARSKIQTDEEVSAECIQLLNNEVFNTAKATDALELELSDVNSHNNRDVINIDDMLDTINSQEGSGAPDSKIKDINGFVMIPISVLEHMQLNEKKMSEEYATKLDSLKDMVVKVEAEINEYYIK